VGHLEGSKPERELPLLKALKGAIIAGRSNDRQAGSNGDTGLARGYIIFDGWCNRARRGANSTTIVAPRVSGPRQDTTGTLLLSIQDRS